MQVTSLLALVACVYGSHFHNELGLNITVLSDIFHRSDLLAAVAFYDAAQEMDIGKVDEKSPTFEEMWEQVYMKTIHSGVRVATFDVSQEGAKSIVDALSLTKYPSVMVFPPSFTRLPTATDKDRELKTATYSGNYTTEKMSKWLLRQVRTMAFKHVRKFKDSYEISMVTAVPTDDLPAAVIVHNETDIPVSYAHLALYFADRMQFCEVVARSKKMKEFLEKRSLTIPDLPMLLAYPRKQVDPDKSISLVSLESEPLQLPSTDIQEMHKFLEPIATSYEERDALRAKRQADREKAEADRKEAENKGRYDKQRKDERAEKDRQRKLNEWSAQFVEEEQKYAALDGELVHMRLETPAELRMKGDE